MKQYINITNSFMQLCFSCTAFSSGPLVDQLMDKSYPIHLWVKTKVPYHPSLVKDRVSSVTQTQTGALADQDSYVTVL